MNDQITMLHLLFADEAAERQLEDPLHQHIFRCGVLVRLMLLLEHHKANFGDAEIEALREMRNAVIHNSGDLSLNKNASSLSLVRSYLANLSAGSVASMHDKPLRPFFTLHGSRVQFDVGGISEHCRQVFMKMCASRII